MVRGAAGILAVYGQFGQAAPLPLPDYLLIAVVAAPFVALRIQLDRRKRERWEEERAQIRADQEAADAMERASDYYRQADRLAMVSTKYREGRPDKGRSMLLAPETDWKMIAWTAAFSADRRARQISDVLTTAEGPASFVRDLHQAGAAQRQHDLQVLRDALIGRSAPLPVKRKWRQ